MIKDTWNFFIEDGAHLGDDEIKSKNRINRIITLANGTVLDWPAAFKLLQKEVVIGGDWFVVRAFAVDDFLIKQYKIVTMDSDQTEVELIKEWTETSE